MTMSVMIISAPPRIKPKVRIKNENSPPVSIAGKRSEKKVEASIIPAALDIIKEKAFWLTFL